MDTDQNYVNKEPELSKIFPDQIVNKISRDQLTLFHSYDNIPPIHSSTSIEQDILIVIKKSIIWMTESSLGPDKDMEIQEIGSNSFTKTSGIKYKEAVRCRKSKIPTDDKLRTNDSQMNEWLKQTKDLKIIRKDFFYTLESSHNPPDIIDTFLKKIS